MSIVLKEGYYWGPKIWKPQQLRFTGIQSYYSFEPGIYDIITTPFGDNWAIHEPNSCNYTTVTLTSKASFSFLPMFDKDEPSCGFLICIRGPYTDGTPVEQRGKWRINNNPDGMIFGRLSVPVYTHSGARNGRYIVNGYGWAGEWMHPDINSNYWGRNPVGPKLQYSNSRAEIKIPKAPKVTKISALKMGAYYVAISKLDMFGRESELSEPLLVNITADAQFMVVRRDYDVEIGACGFYLYLGTSPDNLHRQPILNTIDARPKFVWPIQLQQFYIHEFHETNIKHVVPPSYGIASIITKPLKDIVDGKTDIIFEKDSYDLYCPFMLPWNPSKFGRRIGFSGKKCKFTHKTNYGDAKLIGDIPLLYIQNQADEVANATFQSSSATCGVTFSDWSGGQAFSNALTNCVFSIGSEDSYGLLIEDTSSIWWGNHTVSELEIKGCFFYATIPVKIEGNQSAKIRFMDMCTFHSHGNTQYRSDTAIIYACCPNQISFKQIEGINGDFRTIICAASYAGQTNVILEDLYCDQGCNVYITMAAYTGAKVIFRSGERINSHSQTWIRMVEAPTALNSQVKFDDLYLSDQLSCISFQLNGLALNLDSPIAEIVCPSIDFWVAKGLSGSYGDSTSPIYHDFMKRRIKDYSFAHQGIPDSITSKSPDIVSQPIIMMTQKKKLSSHWMGIH